MFFWCVIFTHEPIITKHMPQKSARLPLVISWVMNLCMGIVELWSWVVSGSSSLIADSLDFFIDGVNYFSSFVILKKSKKIHTRIGKIKGFLMLLFGIGILVFTGVKWMQTYVPRGEIMSTVGFLALFVNLFSTGILQKFQNENLDLRAVWLCTRNDVIWNILIIVAGYLTVYFESTIPDMFVSVFMGFLICKSGVSILQNKYQKHMH